MNIQSLSIVVPGGCPNNCHYCVSKTHKDIKYKDEISNVLECGGVSYDQYINKMNFARDNGCNTVILTGEGEPVFNKSFLEAFGRMNKSLDKPFRWIELQTSGILLDDDMLKLLKNIDVNTISLSLASFVDKENIEYNQISKKNEFKISEVTERIKDWGFNLRLSLNATDAFDRWSPAEIFNIASVLGADQLTFRILYDDGDENSSVYQWIDKHRVNGNIITQFTSYVVSEGVQLEQLSFGPYRYSVNGISVVIDSDCMSEEVKNSLKYLILRQDCKLYTKWDDKGSLLF